jgi:hypothetical protein
MSKINFHQVTTLPGSLQPDSFYYVINSNYVESYLTNNAGAAKMIGNSTMINALIDTKLVGLNALEIVADIATRDALVLTKNTMVLVTDASADATVTAGAALYAYKQSNTSFVKVAEYESLDVIVNWTDVQGKPTSAVGDIDDAVTKKHAHTNKTELDKIDEDIDGDITYDGNPVVIFKTDNW